MKNFTEMKFGDYTFIHNPKTLTVKNIHRGKSTVIPYLGTYFEPTSPEAAVITGQGLITGSDCFKKLIILLQYLKSGESRLLSISPMPALRAVLTSLEYTLSPKENCIDISFGFTASEGEKSSSKILPKTCTVSEDETLWDISYKYGVAVEALLNLNTFVKRPDVLKKGWVIRLC